MRVGVISRGSPDYLVDIVADGMIRLLGRASVALDYNIRSLDDPVKTQLFQGFQGPEPFPIEDAEILVASVRSWDALCEWQSRTGQMKTAILDGEDDAFIREPWWQAVKVYFKRECFPGRPRPQNVRPLPFGAIPEEMPEPKERLKRPIFMGLLRGRIREEVNGILASMGFGRAEILQKAVYNGELASSLVGVSVRGGGWDTYRYWETAYFGAALLAQRMPIEIPGNFADGSEAVFWDDPVDFRRKLEAMLGDPEGTAAIGQAGQRACQGRHLSTNRARTVLEALA